MLYYLPGLTRLQLTRELLAERGVPSDLHDPQKRVACDVLANGPDGSSGVIISHQPHHGYYRDKQTWHEFRDVWIGWDCDHHPTPESLQRTSIVNGYTYELGDGQTWICPVLRAHGRRWNLPTTWGMTRDGLFSQQVMPGYENEMELAERIYDISFAGEDCSTSEVYAMCCQLLAVNYVLCPRGVSALGLLTSETYGKVFKAAIDGPALEALLAEDLAIVSGARALDGQKKSTDEF